MSFQVTVGQTINVNLKCYRCGKMFGAHFVAPPLGGYSYAIGRCVCAAEGYYILHRVNANERLHQA